MAFHRLQQIVARRVRRQVQLRIERIELEDVVMKRSRTGARTKIGPRPNPRTVARAIRQITRCDTLGQALRRPGILKADQCSVSPVPLLDEF